MTAREYLEQFEDAVKLVEQLREEYAEQMEQIDNIRSSLGGDGLPHGADIRREVEEKALALAEKAQELKEAEIWAVATEQQIFRTIIELQGVHRDVLIERYVHLKKWEDVADAVGYCVSRTHVKHKEALQMIQNFIDGKEKTQQDTFL